MADQSTKVDRKDNVNTTTTTTTTVERPRLSYLRSAWTTSDLYYHESAFSQSSVCTTSSSSEDLQGENNIYQLKLPLVQLQDCDEEEEESDEVLKEIFRMITVANILCVASSLINTSLVICTVPSYRLFLEHSEWLPHLILPFYILWWLFMMLVLKNRTTEHLRQYLNWAQLAAIVMTLTNFFMPIRQHFIYRHYYHLIVVSSSFLSFFMYAFAKRMTIANELKYDRFKKRLSQQQDKLQQFIDKSTNEFNDQRTGFLTTVSQEIQDVALMVITTLEQFSPTSVLSNTPELLSACSIAVPIASISAINTTIRQVCHVSSHLELLSKLALQSVSTARLTHQLPKLNLAEFDIGELLQNLGDALAGVAAKLDVSLIIYHCDNTLHHTLVIGDEGAIRHALLNHIRNILECCTPGASIEVGLNVNKIRDPKKLSITFYITHTTSPAIRNASVALLPNANLTAQLLSYINATCTIDTNSKSNQTKFEFSFELGCGKKDNTKMFLNKDGASYLLKNHYANIKFSNEPSLKELNKFIEHLKGLKMVLHAPEHSIFAKHMTSCLASWNTDISHVPVTHLDDASVCSSVSGNDTPDHHSNASTPNIDNHTTPRQPSTPPIPTPAIEEEHIHSIPPAFILIDDDIATLENKLCEFRSQPAASANMLQQAHQGRRSNNPYFQHGRKTSSTQNFFHQGTTAIIHFTSLTNYKAVRDTIQCFAVLPSRDPFSMPRVVVVPKPAGPRRFLTALHTAWNNAVVEPHFSAIATSPSSPMPPMISMLVQREIAAATATNSPDSRISPGNETNNNVSPGRRARPTSGIFSPPTDNYFSSQHPRRRSTNNTMSNEIDYITAKTPPADISMAPVPVAATTTNVDVDIASAILPSNEPTTTPSSSSNSMTPPAINPNEPIVTPKFDAPIDSPATTEEPVLKKKFGRTMSNFKLHKKKRKDKGTPFANVVSPPINVLIVEDNIINQAILSAWMKKHKIKFSVASNGLEAVNKWKIGGFHLILMDIQLPVMNGIEATKMIRSIEKEQKIGVLPMSSSFLRQQQEVAAATAETMMNPALSDSFDMDKVVAAEMMLMNQNDDKQTPSIFRSPVIIVALTASSLESDRHAALAAGCNDFLTKPVSLEWLEKKIIEWGCMQALIDFEGWRRWKKNSSTDDTLTKKKLANLTNNTQQQISTVISGEQIEAEKKRIEEKSKLNKNNGILLPGVSNLIKSKRVTTLNQQQQRIVLKTSKSESDTMTLRMIRQEESQSDTTITTQNPTINSSVLLDSRSRSTSKEQKFDTNNSKDKLPHKPESRSSSS